MIGPNADVGRALVRRPGPRLTEGIVTHIDRDSVDVGHAREQWEAYVGAMTDARWEIVEVPPADDCPDAVFVEDTVVMFGDRAMITNPGALSRRAETAAVEDKLAELGYAVDRIHPPGTLDGGDVLKTGDAIYVGRGGRTNAEGIRQLRDLLAPRGFRVVAVPLDSVLHLKSAVTALADGTFVGYPPAVDAPDLFPMFRAVPEESGAHVVLLDPGTVLLAASCPKSAELFRDLGYDTVAVDISEFEKLEGGVTCLSVRIRPHCLSVR